jgi:alkanesulfonate monooxygenase SsuD/methylene tetrahydromethanopterin reductase-like flavin-dependent oxidoreductase (luciferase family)
VGGQVAAHFSLQTEGFAMQIGLIIPHWTGAMAGNTPTASDVVNFARAAPEFGLDALWATDHLYHEPYLDFLEHGYQLPDEMKGFRNGFWESWTLLAALAARTEQVELGTLVSNTAFRNPALLANMVETVDSLSNGRLTVGLGAGDFRSEHDFHGYPWANRVSRFEEALQIIAPLLRGERMTFTGDYYEVNDVSLAPKGPRNAGPPIFIGTMRVGPRMQRLAVEYGDGWSCWLAFEDSRVENFTPRLEKINAACERLGRDPATMRSSVTVGVTAPGIEGLAPGAEPISGSPDAVAEEIQKYRDVGVDHLAIYLHPCSESGLEWLAEALARVKRPSLRA